MNFCSLLGIDRWMKLNERIEALVSAATNYHWLGALTAENIFRWIELELGHFLDETKPQEYGHHHCLAQALSPILHVVSGNTPHAALQSLIRGIVVGAQNWMKLPRGGLPEVGEFSLRLPEALRPELADHLTQSWVQEAEAVVVFGNDETVHEFSRRLLPTQRLLAHGHKISFGLIRIAFDQQVVNGAALDVFVFDQLGCLSPQLYYVAGDSVRFASMLATRLDELCRAMPVTTMRGYETAAALRSCREEWKFRAATEPGILVWESPGTLEWVVIHDPAPGLVANPLYRTIFIKPMPADLGSVLAPLRRHISTVGLHPVDLDSVELAARLGAQRVCQIGQMQNPPMTWHHDGWPTLLSLVRYVDVEGLEN
jgi:Acyl-CoA reductase (LuxC)